MLLDAAAHDYAGNRSSFGGDPGVAPGALQGLKVVQALPYLSLRQLDLPLRPKVPLLQAALQPQIAWLVALVSVQRPVGWGRPRS